MKSTAPTPAIGEPTLEHLLQELITNEDREGEHREKFDKALVQVVDAIRRELVCRFGQKDFTSEAAHSMARTLLRRARDSELTLDVPDGIERFLVGQAIAKAYALRDKRGRRLYGNEPGVAADGPAENDGLAVRGGEVRRYVGQLLAEMDNLLKNDCHRSVFLYLFEVAYEGKELKTAQIAAKVGVSNRTVERVRKQFNEVWLNKVKHSRQELDRGLAQA